MLHNCRFDCSPAKTAVITRPSWNHGLPVRDAGRSASIVGTFRPTRQLLLWAALFFAFGLWVGKYTWRPASWWLFAALIFSASAIYLLKRRTLASSLLIFGTFFIAGALSIQIRGSRTNESQPWFDSNQVWATSHVISEGNIQSEAPGSLRQRIDVETEQVKSDTQTKAIQEGADLTSICKPIGVFLKVPRT